MARLAPDDSPQAEWADADLVREGSVETTLSEASDTVRLPGEGVQWAPSAEADTELEFQAIETPEHPKSDGRTRVTATDLVEAADESSHNYEDNESLEETIGDTDLPRNQFGAIVHRVLEFDMAQSEWPALIRRVAGVNGFNVPDETVEELLAHIDDASSFLEGVAAQYPDAETYEELTVSVDMGDIQIIGDIDHLHVTPDAFVITDYKTNRVGQRTTEALAEHYRPQIMSYALALLESDPEKDIIANLRFTTVGETELFQWSRGDREALETELRSLEEAVEK